MRTASVISYAAQPGKSASQADVCHLSASHAASRHGRATKPDDFLALLLGSANLIELFFYEGYNMIFDTRRNVTSLAVLLAVSTACFLVPSAQAGINDGLIAYYPFDGNANDASGNGNHATAYNDYSYVPGSLGDAIHLVGSGDTGLVGGHVRLPSLPFNTMDEFTIGMWVNHQGNTSGPGESFISFGDSDGGHRVQIHYNYAGTSLPNSTLSFDTGSGQVSTNYGANFLNNWQHLTLRADSGTLTGFVNGQSVGTDSFALNSMVSNAALGAHWWSGGSSSSNRFIGSIDDVRIWDRALSASEVGALSLNTTIDNSRGYEIPLSQSPSGRLAEWNGTSWVEPGDLSSGNIRVLVHGWGNGEFPWVSSNSGSKVWDMRSIETNHETDFTNGETDFFDDLQKVAVAMKDANASDRILAYSWIDKSATPIIFSEGGKIGAARNSKANTDDAARLLQYALFDAGVGANTEGIHLLGHSHGARVATLAALGLEGVGAQVDQLTLWDSPEVLSADFIRASNSLTNELSWLDIGTAAGQTFVDNYYSRFGEPYPEVVNVLLSPKDYGESGASAEHAYPITWYTKEDVDPRVNGLAWSPLNGGIIASLLESDAYFQDVDDEFLLVDANTNLTRRFDSSALQTTDVGTTGLVNPASGGKFLIENSPAFWDSIITLGENDVAIQFDYDFLNVGDGDQLGIWIDDELRLILTGEVIGQGLTTTTIGIADLAAGDHLLTVALHSTGDANAEVFVGNFQAISVVPEPSTLALLTLSIIALLPRGVRRRSGG